MNASDILCKTLLHTAAKKSNVEVIETLLKHQAGTNTINGKGENCVHLAVENAQFEEIECLVKEATDHWHQGQQWQKQPFNVWWSV